MVDIWTRVLPVCGKRAVLGAPQHHALVPQFLVYRCMIMQFTRSLHTVTQYSHGRISSASNSQAVLLAMASMPSLLYGTAWKDIRTADLVLLAFVHGFRAVDTAGQPKHYKEDLVGKGLDAACAQLELQRRDIWIQTK